MSSEFWSAVWPPRPLCKSGRKQCARREHSAAVPIDYDRRTPVPMGGAGGGRAIGAGRGELAVAIRYSKGSARGA